MLALDDYRLAHQTTPPTIAAIRTSLMAKARISQGGMLLGLGAFSLTGRGSR